MKFITNKRVIILCLLAIIASLVFIKFNSSDNGIKSYFGSNIDSAEIDQYLTQKMKQNPIPGLALGIINDGKLIHQVYKGYENLETQKPVNKATLFEAASLSKSVFGSMVMQQVERNQFELDRPLFDYYPVDYLEDTRFKQITARMALSHQTGWPNWRWDRKDNKLEFRHSPGDTYLYSGEGYQYLAETLRHIHGGSWQDLEQQFQNLIAKPLGMNNSTFIEPSPVSPLKAKPYDLAGELVDFQSLSDYQRNRGVFVAAASLITNIEDFSKWIIGLMDNSLLTSESQSEMLTGQVGTGHHLLQEIDYTLGFFELVVPGLAPLYGHGGNNHGFTGYFVFSPEKKWGYVLLSNSEYGEQLGVEVLGFLATGPNLAPFIIIAVFSIILLIALLIAFSKVMFRLFKNNENSK